MARPSHITDEQILEAAREEFLAKGFSATTAAIARRAGVSQGTIFKRFPSKEKLFVATLDAELGELSQIMPPAGSNTLAFNLQTMVANGIRFFSRVMPLMMAYKGAKAPEHRLFEGFEIPPPVRQMIAFRKYIEEEARLGRLSVEDASITARLLMAAATHRVFWTHAGLPILETDEEYVRKVVQHLLEDITPHCGGGDVK